MVPSERKSFETSQTKPALPNHHDSQFLDRSETEHDAARQDTSGQAVRPESGNFADFFSRSQMERTAGSGQEPAAALPEQLILGRYRARKWLGQGGFGRVYLAEDTRLGREVAVKVVPVRQEESSSKLTPGRRGDSEARTLAKLDHRAIIPVYDVGLDETLGYCTVAKYVRGVTLAARMQQSRLSAWEAVTLVICICDGLQHAHELEIFHRDIKPSNILLDKFGQPHIADFGLAIHEKDQADHRGEVSGSPSYMAPEQFRGFAHLMDGRADLWSVGVILYELLTGKKPFVGATEAELVEAVLHKAPKPLRLIHPEIDIRLEEITLRCLRKESADRYPMARDLADELRSWQATTIPPASPWNTSHHNSVESDAPTNFRRLPTAIPIVIAVALVGLLLLGVDGSRWGSEKLGNQSRPTSEVRSTANLAQPVDDSSPLDLSLKSELDGQLQVLLWPHEPVGQDSPMELTDSLPVPSDAQVRIQVELTTAAYAYILWLDGDGNVFPLYPWREGNWEERPDVESTVMTIGLPNEPSDDTDSRSIRSSWKVSPTLAMETILLLASSEPLLETFDFEGELSRYRSPEAEKRNAWVEIREDQLQVHETRERGPVLDAVESLEQAHSRLVRRLKATFPVIRGIAFSTERPRDAPTDFTGNATNSD